MGMNHGMLCELVQDIERCLTRGDELGKGYGITYKVEYDGTTYCMKKYYDIQIRQ